MVSEQPAKRGVCVCGRGVGERAEERKSRKTATHRRAKAPGAARQKVKSGRKKPKLQVWDREGSNTEASISSAKEGK